FRSLHLAPSPRLHSFPTRRSYDLADVLDGHRDRVGPRHGILVRTADRVAAARARHGTGGEVGGATVAPVDRSAEVAGRGAMVGVDRKSTRLNSSHVSISYGVF